MAKADLVNVAYSFLENAQKFKPEMMDSFCDLCRSPAVSPEPYKQDEAIRELLTLFMSAHCKPTA